MSYKFFLQGLPPSKKNRHVIVKNKKSGTRFVMPDQTSVKWQEWARKEFLTQRNNTYGIYKPFSEAVEISYRFLTDNVRMWDLSNKIESINDSMIGVLIHDDNRFKLRRIGFIEWRPVEGIDIAGTVIIIEPWEKK